MRPIKNVFGGYGGGGATGPSGREYPRSVRENAHQTARQGVVDFQNQYDDYLSAKEKMAIQGMTANDIDRFNEDGSPVRPRWAGQYHAGDAKQDGARRMQEMMDSFGLSEQELNELLERRGYMKSNQPPREVPGGNDVSRRLMELLNRGR